MYLSHFGLKEKPFQISPDPRFLWLGETHKEALARLKFGIHDNRGFLLLVGDVGTGKTTLINSFLGSLDNNTLVATVSDPGLEKIDFFNFLVSAFNIDKQFTSKGDFLVHFIHFLHKAHDTGKRVLIIIDEAQRLNHEMLEEIRQLSNIETQDAKLLNIFLVGQNELNDTLLENRNRALLQRITTRYSIGPIPAKEVTEYIKFRLAVAGCDTPLFSAGAVHQVTSFSNCYPRLINVICDHALLTAFARGKKKIDARIVKECAEELSIETEKVSDDRKKTERESFLSALFLPWRRSLVGTAVSVLLLGLLAVATGLFYFQDVGGPEKPAVSATPAMGNEKGATAIQQPKEATPEVSPRADETTAPSGLGNVAVPTAANGETPGASSARKPDNSPVLSEAEIQATLDQKFIIRFQMDSNDFSDEAYAMMNRIAHVAKQVPEIDVQVTGYTDSLGNYDYNRRLSEFRANVVKSYLTGQGVAPSQIHAAGKGPEDPIAGNETKEGRAANRRVEIALHRGAGN